MGMQYDVKQAHLNSSGYLVNYGTRVKGMSFTGGASAGYVVLFDASSVPVSSSVTYAQSGNTVTVTKAAHGLTTGAVIGIHFLANGSGISATDGTYSITRVDANTFTLTDINSRTITSTAAVYAVGRWLLTYESFAGDYFSNTPIIPGEGLRAGTSVYAEIFNMDSMQIYYG
jgi:hypothetical protein